MTKIVCSFSAIAIILGALLHAGAAGATAAPAARTWVSGVGSDANPCTRALPCATFQQAYMNTLAGGEIDVLDGGDFGRLTIQEALTVADDGVGSAAISSPADGIDVNVGSTDVVVLRGLTLNGARISGVGIFLGSGSLLIDHCKIQGFPSAAGIVAFGGKLLVTDTVLSNAGSTSNGSIWIAPSSGATVTALLERVKIFNAIGNGIRFDGVFGGAIIAGLHDVTVDGATGGSGIVAVSGGAAVNLVADEITSSNNAGYGVRAVGATASVLLSRSTITNNGEGIRASGGAAFVSYSDNRFANNSSGDGSPTAMMGLK